jgi:CDP-glucose 4,6-dehydratase
MEAKVTGFALAPDTDPNLFEGAGVAADAESYIGDLRQRDEVRGVVKMAAPDIVLHMAAQAIVRRAFREPVETVATNVLGTMHLLDALRDLSEVRVILVITSDKVYENAERGIAFREDDGLGGREIYGASKAATEILTRAMAHSHFANGTTIVAIARGGNVIGGGDYAEDRLVPDVVRAVQCGEPPVLRNPDAVRPWQHVLDCIAGYLVYIQALVACAECWTGARGRVQRSSCGRDDLEGAWLQQRLATRRRRPSLRVPAPYARHGANPNPARLAGKAVR